MVSIEYRIDPARADEFRALMLESRRSRLSHGALSWELLRDLGEPGRFVEQIVDPSGTTTCAASAASPPPTPRCASESWPFTSASRPRW
jgi:hypothetical protein